MHPFLTLAQICVLAAMLCALHGARAHIGRTPFHLVMGMLVVMLFVIGDFGFTVDVPLFWSGGVPLDTALLLPLVLTGQVMVYVFEGTRAARRLLLGILCLQLLHHGLDSLLVWHATTWADPASVPMDRLPSPDLPQRLASMGAFVLDFVVLIVSYQFMVNRLPWLPDLVRLVAAMLFAMATDAVAYSGLLVQFGQIGGFPFVEKIQSVTAAAIPTSAYVWFGLRYGHVSELGGKERRVLDVIDLRARLELTQARLVEAERHFADVQDVFERYVSPEVVAQILEDPSAVALGGEEREVSVLFSDIAGYSSISEVLSPTEIIDLLNQYFQQMTHPILARRGMINEFEGDGILAIFGAPLSISNHAQAAVDAAVEMLEAVEALNATWEADGTLDKWRPCGVERLRVRIGIHSGPVVAGNVGSDARIKYAVIGDTVNVAARVEALNKTLGTSLLLTAETAGELDKTRALKPQGAHVVKGRNEPVEVFSVDA